MHPPNQMWEFEMKFVASYKLSKVIFMQKRAPSLIFQGSCKKRLKAKIFHAYRGHIYALCIWYLGSSSLLYFRTGPKCVQKPRFWPLGGLYWTISLIGLEHTHMYPHTKFERPKWNIFWVITLQRNLCGGSGETVLNPKYTWLCLGIQ